MTADAFDVLVVGGGPAGAVAATALAKRGMTVLLVDDSAPADAPSYELLVTGPALRGLTSLGLTPSTLSLPADPIDTIDLRFGGTSSREMSGTDMIVCDGDRFRRALRQAAADAGATTLAGRVTSLSRSSAAQHAVIDHHGTSTTIAATHVIGAFGSADPTPRAAAADSGSAPPADANPAPPAVGGLASLAVGGSASTGDDGGSAHSTGLACARRFSGVACDGRMTLVLEAPAAAHPDEPPACAWILPGPGDTCTVGAIRVGGRGTPAPEDLMAAAMNALTTAGALPPTTIAPAGPVFGAPLNTGFTPGRVAGADILLVGDAAGLVNPFTGEGISYAVQSGLLAAHCVARNPGNPDAARRRYARRLAATFVGYFETARHATRRYHLAWRILAASADSDHPFFAKGRRAILLPDGFSGLTASETMNITGPDAAMLAAFLAACDEVAVTTIRREWPFLARLAMAEDGGGHNRLRPAIPFFAAMMATGTQPDIGRATVAAALELALLGTLAVLGPAPPPAPGRGVDWALTATVLAGDFLLSQASRLVAESAPELSWSFAEWLAELTTLRADRLDASTGTRTPAGAVYASLLEFPARIGAELGGSPPPVAASLRDFGSHCGHAFVHAEDVLALCGERTRLDTTLAVMLDGRFSAIPDSLGDRPVSADVLTTDRLLRSQALTAARAGCGDAHRRALEAIDVVPDPAAARILREFATTIAAPARVND